MGSAALVVSALGNVGPALADFEVPLLLVANSSSVTGWLQDTLVFEDKLSLVVVVVLVVAAAFKVVVLLDFAL